MATGRSTRQALARRDVAFSSTEGVDPRGIVRRMLGHRDELSPPLTESVIGPLAGLLITKWAAYEEAEREAVAAFDGDAFVPELPPALRYSAWELPSEGRADAVVAALKNTTPRHAARFRRGISSMWHHL